MAYILGGSKLIAPFSKYLGENSVLNLVGASDKAELYHVNTLIDKEDPYYLLATSDKAMIEFGETGLIRKFSYKEKNKVKVALEKNGRNEFVLEERIPEFIDSFKGYSKNQLEVQLIDYAYSHASKIPDDYNKVIAKKFKDFTADRVIARFKDFKFLVDPRDIIPDGNSDYQVPIVTTMEGCAYNCGHCPIGGGIKDIKTKEDIRNSISRAKKILNEYHHKIKDEFEEGFINASDIWWHLLSPKSELSPLEIIAMYKDAFPDVIKLGTFFGIRNTIRVIEKIDSDYLNKMRWNILGSGNGITRAYVGVETGHDLAAMLINKPERYDDKIKAIKYIKDASIAVKAIVQIGVFGEGFYRDEEDIGKKKTKDNFVSWKEIADKTVDVLIEMAPYRIMPSVFLPLKNLPVLKLIEQGRIVRYNDPRSIDREKNYIHRKLKKAHDEGRVRWQGEKSLNSSLDVPWEDNYEQFVGKAGRKAA